MELEQGMCISSTAAMEDSHFVNAILLLTEINESGATGFIFNKPLGRGLNELKEFTDSKPFPLYSGGPVDEEHLYFIHRQPVLISGGQLIVAELYFGGNFSEAVAAINAGLLATDDIKIFVGYCGWDVGEVEAEIAEGSWEITALSTGDLFR